MSLTDDETLVFLQKEKSLMYTFEEYNISNHTSFALSLYKAKT